jgi:hypothetical protein
VTPTTHESRNTNFGNPKNAPLKKSAKVVLVTVVIAMDTQEQRVLVMRD